MKRLILMRHAKSDWSGESLNDHDRQLNQRGRNSAHALGDWLRQKRLIPDEVLCSSAVRTRETLSGLGLPEGISTTFTRKLYLASMDEILGQMQRAQGDVVLMLGHNPGIGMCADALVTSPPDHPQFMAYPTGATLVADFDIDDWSAARWHKGSPEDFVVPKDL
ncbi:phosphoglycerate mutase [Sulfitobacter alexandrii]|uniref:Phosphoglycerate mutase n=1 Tax=Sulfitobacter alexandrii TaxID=1917485 RepID=A0A1J0WDG7_9RHOB|nr:histidine phosphatase family protein [Sulfitobacter alexandrii]APE42354.1 phosphoglycerate mutase [Sulfitobacter alexandrii]